MNGPVTTPTINQGRKSSHGGAIAGGVIGGLAALVLVGIGALILRKRLRARGDQGYSEYHRVSAAGPIVSEFGGKPNIRLYVRRSFTLLTSFLTDTFRTRTIHPPFPPLSMPQVRRTLLRILMVVIPVSLNCKKLDNGLFFLYPGVRVALRSASIICRLVVPRILGAGVDEILPVCTRFLLGYFIFVC